MMRDVFFIRFREAMSRRDDSGSAMIMVLMLMLIFAVAGATLAVVIGVNGRLTLQTAGRGTSVYIAEAGLETTLGTLRGATSTAVGVGYGDLTHLPCQTGAPYATVTGSIDGSNDVTKQFVVTVRYGLEDPSSHARDTAWLNAPQGSVSAPTGYGPLTCDQIIGGAQPYFALVEAAASQGEVGARTLLAVYHFNLDGTRAIIGGGEIKPYTATSYCLRAYSTTGTATKDTTAGASYNGYASLLGAKVYYTTHCDRTDPDASALLGWVYNDHHQIQLFSTIPSDDEYGGLCIAGPAITSTVTTSVPQTYYRIDYSFSRVTVNSTDKPDGTNRTSTTAGTYNAFTNTTGDQASAASLSLASPISGTDSTTRNYRYYLRSGTTPTLGAAGSPQPVAPKAGETSRTETYQTYTADYRIGGTSSRYSAAVSAAGYPRFVTVNAISTVTTGGTPIYNAATGTTPAAVLVDCATGKVYDSSGNVTATAGPNDIIWGWNDSADWKSQSGNCLYAGNTTAPAEGNVLSILTNCTGQAQNTWSAFQPEAKVGAGAAGAGTNQLVNFLEFGRCTDVTDQTITSPNNMIAYPCKQNADGSQINWNQKWSYKEPSAPDYTAKTRITVVNGGSSGTNGATYCLVAPATAGGYVSFATGNAACGSGTGTTPATGTNPTPANAIWTRYTDTGRYGTSYIFVSSNGLCLATDSSHVYNGWSKIVVQSCNGQANQKWNAPADLQDGGLGDYQEIPAGGAH